MEELMKAAANSCRPYEKMEMKIMLSYLEKFSKNNLSNVFEKNRANPA